MSGPLDESRHPIIRVGEDGTQTYTPKPERDLTDEDRQRIEDLQAIERWQDYLYAQRAARRKTRSEGTDAPDEGDNE